MNKLLFVIALTTFTLMSCKQVHYYTLEKDTNGTITINKEQGLKFYYPKPYLLVEKTDTTLTSKIIYLPDLENPTYVHKPPSLRKNTVNLTLSNGILTNLGDISESQLPEVLSSTAAILTSVATLPFNTKAAQVVSQLSNPIDTTKKQIKVELYEILMQNGVTKLKEVKFEN